MRKFWGFAKFVAESVVLTFLMSGAEIAINAAKMAFQAVFYGATMNRSDTVTLANVLKREALVKTNFVEVLAQAVLIIIAINLCCAIWRKIFKKEVVS